MLTGADDARVARRESTDVERRHSKDVTGRKACEVKIKHDLLLSHA